MEFLLNKPNYSNIYKLYIKSNDPKGNVELAKEIILKEYSKYPNIIKKSKIKAVNLVSNLQVKNDINVDKYVKVSETSDPEVGWMYIDVDYLNQKTYFKQCINHEIWHLYDYAHHGSFKPKDDKWESLNPKDFKYGKGGAYAYHNEFNNEFHPQPGFITSYATLGIDEDKAEVFMYYFSDNLKSKLDKIMGEDSVLKQKVELILNEVNEESPVLIARDSIVLRIIKEIFKRLFK